VIGLTCGFTDTAVRLLRKDGAIGLPEIAEAVTTSISLRDLFPELATGLLAAIPDHKRHDLTSPTAQGCPEPPLIRAFGDEGPQFI